MLQEEGDKSKYLALAGFTLENAPLLEQAIRDVVANNDATSQGRNAYGETWEVVGVLKGPIRSLGAIVILLHRDDDGLIQFVTLFPDSP